MNCEEALRKIDIFFVNNEKLLKWVEGAIVHCFFACDANKSERKCRMYGNLLIFKRTTHLIKDKTQSWYPFVVSSYININSSKLFEISSRWAKCEGDLIKKLVLKFSCSLKNLSIFPLFSHHHSSECFVCLLRKNKNEKTFSCQKSELTFHHSPLKVDSGVGAKRCLNN